MTDIYGCVSRDPPQHRTMANGPYVSLRRARSRAPYWAQVPNLYQSAPGFTSQFLPEDASSPGTNAGSSHPPFFFSGLQLIAVFRSLFFLGTPRKLLSRFNLFFAPPALGPSVSWISGHTLPAGRTLYPFSRSPFGISSPSPPPG